MGRTQSGRFNLRIEESLLAELERVAKAKDRSVAWIVRDALRQYIERERTRSPDPDA